MMTIDEQSQARLTIVCVGSYESQKGIRVGSFTTKEHNQIDDKACHSSLYLAEAATAPAASSS